jgi:molecular chaperone DnaK
MYLGIDLGTSNSAIAGYGKDGARLFKTPDGHDVLPSAVMIDRRANLLGGRRAYEQSAYSPENVAQGFKRLMGTSTLLHFASARNEMTAEQASTEILKALVSQAHMSVGDFEIDGAVITIPAAFNQMQSEATMRSAAAAGITNVALLQEPIAAAMASIAGADKRNGQFLIYDLGGGTFDAAIVQSISGSITVIAHAGINMLGGRDFDRSIVNSVIRPWLLGTFELPESFQTLPQYQRLIRIAQFRAELTKIALSTQTNDRIFADETQINIKDEAGSNIYLDVEISRGELEKLVIEDVDRSIELCRTLLQENGYRPSDIDRIVLIGGPSRMPVVRSRVVSELGINADLKLDPMTAVAFGAAIFAEGREWAAGGAVKAKTRVATEIGETLPISFDFPSRTADKKARIRVSIPSEAKGRRLRVQVDTEDGWTSGQVTLKNTSEIRDIPLSRGGDNKIRVCIFDENGTIIGGASKDLTIFRADAASDGMPMTHNLAVKIVTGAIGSERNILMTLVKKGTLVPKSGVEHFRAARALRKGDGKYLDFELYEQTEGVDDPELNLAIGEFRLSSDELSRGDVIRRGDDLFIHWAIDANGLLNCELEFPSLSRTYNTGKMYVSTVGHRNFDGEDGKKLSASVLQTAKSDIIRLDRALGEKTGPEVSELMRRLDRQVDSLRLSADAETRRGITEEARAIRQEVYKIANKPENVRASIRAEIDELSESLSTRLSGVIDPKGMIQLNRLIGVARDSLKREGSPAIDDARASVKEIYAIMITELAKRPDFWVSRFEALAADRHLAADKVKHDRLVAEGETCITKQDLDRLRQVSFELSENIVDMSGLSKSEILAGLMRG